MLCGAAQRDNGVQELEDAFEADRPSGSSHSARLRFKEETDFHVFEDHDWSALGAVGALAADVLQAGVPPLRVLKMLAKTFVFAGISGGIAVGHFFADTVTNASGLLTEHQIVEVGIRTLKELHNQAARMCF